MSVLRFSVKVDYTLCVRILPPAAHKSARTPCLIVRRVNYSATPTPILKWNLDLGGNSFISMKQDNSPHISFYANKKD